MNTFTLIFILCWSLNCTAFNISQFNGPIINTLTSGCCDSVLSSNASFFYCSPGTKDRIEIFKNSGNGFEPFETILTPPKTCFFDVVEDEEKVYVGVMRFMHVFQKINGTYENVMLIDTYSRITGITLVQGLIVTSHFDEHIRFYRLSDYGLERILVAGFRTAGVSETDDRSLLAAGGKDNYTRIF